MKLFLCFGLSLLVSNTLFASDKDSFSVVVKDVALQDKEASPATTSSSSSAITNPTIISSSSYATDDLILKAVFQDYGSHGKFAAKTVLKSMSQVRSLAPSVVLSYQNQTDPMYEDGIYSIAYDSSKISVTHGQIKVNASVSDAFFYLGLTSVIDTPGLISFAIQRKRYFESTNGKCKWFYADGSPAPDRIISKESKAKEQ